MASKKKAKKAKRDSKGRWKKGGSGNPGGRRAIPAELRAKLAKKTPKAIKRLEQLLDSKDERVAIRAVEVLFTRVYGRAQATPLEEPAPSEDKERLSALEQRAAELALGGDTRMLGMMLKALDPQKYGAAEGDAGDFDEEPTAVNFTRRGEARPENKWVPPDASDQDEDTDGP